MIIRTRNVITVEYVAHCEVCGVRIVIAVPGEQKPDVTRAIGTQVALCPGCADQAHLSTAFMLEEEYLGAINGTLNS